MLIVITQMDYIYPSKLFCPEMGCFKPYFSMVKSTKTVVLTIIFCSVVALWGRWKGVVVLWGGWREVAVPWGGWRGIASLWDWLRGDEHNLEVRRADSVGWVCSLW